MELFSEILINALEGGKIEVTFPDLPLPPEELVEMRCYAALRKIKAIVEDRELDDPECFHKIEEIVAVLEDLGSSGGARHDFG